MIDYFFFWLHLLVFLRNELSPNSLIRARHALLVFDEVAEFLQKRRLGNLLKLFIKVVVWLLFFLLVSHHGEAFFLVVKRSLDKHLVPDVLW